MNACLRKEVCLERQDPMGEAERIGAEVGGMQTGTLDVVEALEEDPLQSVRMRCGYRMWNGGTR